MADDTLPRPDGVATRCTADAATPATLAEDVWRLHALIAAAAEAERQDLADSDPLRCSRLIAVAERDARSLATRLDAVEA